MQSWLDRLRLTARSLKSELAAIQGAARDPRTPWYAKGLALLVVAYALSPIDLIPDVIPVLGHLDDLLLVPLGLWAVLRLIPPHVMAEHRAKVTEGARLPRSRTAVIVIVGLWTAAIAAAAFWLLRER